MAEIISRTLAIAWPRSGAGPWRPTGRGKLLGVKFDAVSSEAGADCEHGRCDAGMESIREGSSHVRMLFSPYLGFVQRATEKIVGGAMLHVVRKLAHTTS